MRSYAAHIFNLVWTFLVFENSNSTTRVIIVCAIRLSFSKYAIFCTEQRKNKYFSVT